MKKQKKIILDEFKKYLLALVIVLLIDLTWIFIIMYSFYNEQLSGFLRPETIPFWSAILAWLLIPLGIVLFVLQVSDTKIDSLVYGGFYGLILYGLYGFTNYATLANWTQKMLLVDILWGIFLCSASSLIIKFILEKW
jgi:uncharacterized membrane protein